MLPSSTQSHDLGIEADSSPCQKEKIAKNPMDGDGWMELLLQVRRHKEEGPLCFSEEGRKTNALDALKTKEGEFSP